MDDLRALRTFLVVAEERHFGRAAARLNLAQPAVSQQIKRLERDLGTTVLLRSTRTVELTDAGAHLEARARTILMEVERTEAEVHQIRRGRAGKVAIGFVGTATYEILPRVSRRLRAELPDIDLELHGEQLSPTLLDMLTERRVDLAVVRNPEPGIDLDVVHLRTEPLIAALPADSVARDQDTVALKDMHRRTFVTHPSGYRSAMFSSVMQACRQAGFTPREVIEVRETSTLVAFVAAGLGVALVPASVRSLALDGVAYRPLSDVHVDTHLQLVTRHGELSAAASTVRGLIIGELRRTPSGPGPSELPPGFEERADPASTP
jgi:DNA-binding transcriptional LysR family regulator